MGEITRLCGYLPLAIGMLASQLRHHPARTAAGLAADLAAARDRLAFMHAENLSVAAVFGQSYIALTPGPQHLFRRLGLVPGPRIHAVDDLPTYRRESLAALVAAKVVPNSDIGFSCARLVPAADVWVLPGTWVGHGDRTAVQGLLGRQVMRWVRQLRLG